VGSTLWERIAFAIAWRNEAVANAIRSHSIHSVWRDAVLVASETPTVRLGPAAIHVSAAIATAIVVVATLGGDGAQETRFAALTAGTARLAFPIFAVAFTASALCMLLPSPATRWLVRNRRHLGLAFAFVHFIHLGALVALNAERDTVPDTVTLVGGGLAYLFVLAMALTSSDAAQRLLRGNWRRLHVIGGWWIWVVFTQSYAGRVVGGAEPWNVYVLLTAVAVAIPLLRFVAWRKRRALE
jgi:sulfoxide reductase heme-binding subunit YedZ